MAVSITLTDLPRGDADGGRHPWALRPSLHEVATRAGGAAGPTGGEPLLLAAVA